MKNVNPFFIPRTATLTAAEFFRVTFEDWLSPIPALFRGAIFSKGIGYSGDFCVGETGDGGYLAFPENS